MYNARMNDIKSKSSKENTLSASELKTVLSNHKIWLETSGRDGESAMLSIEKAIQAEPGNLKFQKLYKKISGL